MREVERGKWEEGSGKWEVESGTRGGRSDGVRRGGVRSAGVRRLTEERWLRSGGLRRLMETLSTGFIHIENDN